MAAGEAHTDSVSVAGRIYAKRSSSRKLIFYDLRGEGAKIQVLAMLEYVLASYVYTMKLNTIPVASKHTEVANGETTFYHIHDTIHRGDIVGVVGTPSMLTKHIDLLFS